VTDAIDKQKSSSKRGTVLILGATSGIARPMAVEFARRGYDLILAGRDDEEVEATAADIRIRYGVTTHPVHFDAVDWAENYESFVDRCEALAGGAEEGAAGAEKAGGLIGAVVCIGYLGDQKLAQEDFDEAAAILDINYTAAAAVLERIAAAFERRRRGFICGISSVAGERGRKSNYHYGAAKAAFTAFLSGLRHRLFKSGVTVTTVKPGFVDTKMVYGMKGMFLVAKPEDVARTIVKAALAGKAEIYTPWFWRAIMFIARNVPEFIWVRTKM
jgi:decaprenylphospho-beta-D-erythro-pentofuranosid-2-ulose 2-reductase